MATGLKVRLDDGSEVGPLELQMVRSWYEQGLINPESAVQRAGSKQWQKLAQAVDLRAWGNLAVSPKKAVRSKSKAAQSSRGRQEVVEEYSGSGGFSFGEHWTTSLAGIVLLVAAAVAAYLNFHAEDAVSFLAREVRAGDLVITLGCGDVWMLGDAALARIAEVDAGG